MTQTIEAGDLRVERSSEGWEISCAVHVEALRVPRRFYYRVLTDVGADPLPRIDPFIPPLLLLAVASGRDLVVTEPISATLLDHLPVVMRIWQQWRPAYRPIEVVAPPDRQERRRAAAAASFFSSGVDSFYTLRTIGRRYPSGDPRAIRYLVVCNGLDIPLADTDRFTRVRKDVAAVAGACALESLACVTNARDYLRGIDWVQFGYGLPLAGVALALESLINCAYVAAAWRYDEMQPGGLHPFVDPLWGTENVDLVHAGADANRAEKIARIAHWPVAQQHLRVCWQNTSSSPNCCRCEKCLRTMIELELAGVLTRSTAFPLPLTTETVLGISIEEHLFPFWEGWLARARGSTVDRTIVSAVEDLVARERFDAAGPGRRFNRLVQAPLGAIGLTPERVKRLDDRLLGGRVVRAARAARRHLVGRSS